MRGLMAAGLVARLLLVPVLAMLAYEFIRFSARYSNNALMRIVVAPNLALQGLTTREPDDGMIEVAIAALNSVLEKEQGTQENSALWQPKQ